MLTTFREWLIKKPVKAIRYVAPTITVVLAGLHHRLGDWTPAFSIIVTSFLSSQLKKKIVGGAVVFLQAGGLNTYDCQLPALVALSVFSTAFDILAVLLFVLYQELFLNTRVVKLALGGLSITLTANLLSLLAVISRILHLNALLQAFQSFATAFSSKWSLYSVQVPLECSLNDVQGINKADDECDNKGPMVPRRHGVAQATHARLPPLKYSSKELRKIQQEDWEVVGKEGEAKNGANVHTDEEKRIQALLDDVNRLIDECQGRDNVDWDGVIAVLENEQKDCKFVEK